MSEQHTTEQPLAVDEHQIIAERRSKLAALRSQGVAFPNDFDRQHVAGDLHAQYGETTREAFEALDAANTPVTVQVAGRMMLKRVMGKAAFATLQDVSGRIQLYINKDVAIASVASENQAMDTEDAPVLSALDIFKTYDLGDILGAEGTLFKTKTGELTVHVTALRLLTKALRPLPDKFHGLADQEVKYRQRYVDLIVTEQSRNTFKARSKAVSAIRQFMMDAQFLEVETPMLHAIPGGASARPFATHHNALDMPMYLRIAPELYLKRLVVGGFERVFEINRNFRNEGVSPRHNPEFTMMEFYAAYTDYRWLMDFVEQLLRHTAIQATGSATLTYQERELDFSQPFERLTILQAIQQYAPQYTTEQLHDVTFLRGEVKRLGEHVLPNVGLGGLQLALFEATAESQLWNPTFIIDYPIETSPLARESDTQKGLTERFELFMTGREIANGFSELNDPEDQAQRFMAQVAAKDAGDDEAMFFDADYIRALEYGLPPTGGCGIGIDRLVMLLTDSPNIRDVILFPHLRKEEQ